MEVSHAPDLHPAFLQPGMRVGPWRVVSRMGRGPHGVIYRAVKDGGEREERVALEIAVTEWDERYERKLELLSRIHHPGLPRLRGHGLWKSPAGKTYPYIAMEWVETARETAEALEQAAESADPEASEPLLSKVRRDIDAGIQLDRLALEEQRRALARAQQLTPESPSPQPERKRWVVLSLAVLAVVVPLAMKSPRFESGTWEAETLDSGGEDDGIADLGGGVPIASAVVGSSVRYQGVYGPEVPMSPLPGQRRPPCLGTLEIQGGCWMKQDALPPGCPEIAYEWRGSCYVPVLAAPRPITSDD